MKVKQGRILLNLGQKNGKLSSIESEKYIFPNKTEFFPSPNFGFKTDPRPISEKTYMSSCIRDIIFFLEKNGYVKYLHPKFFYNPTSKDFFQILSFLLRKIDENLFLGKKYEENFQWIFNTIYYPFPIPKSSRYSIASQDIWPILLSCLKWITELLRYDCFVLKKKKISYFPRSSPDETLWKQIGNAYFIFINGSQKNKNFQDTFKFFLKYHLYKEKNIRQKKKKKLKNKFINFQTFLKAFIFVKIFDEKEISEKKMIFDFFTIYSSAFISKIKDYEKKNRKSKTKKKYFLFSFHFKSKKNKEREFWKIVSNKKIPRIFAARKTKTRIYSHYFLVKIKNLLFLKKFF